MVYCSLMAPTGQWKTKNWNFVFFQLESSATDHHTTTRMLRIGRLGLVPQSGVATQSSLRGGCISTRLLSLLSNGMLIFFHFVISSNRFIYRILIDFCLIPIVNGYGFQSQRNLFSLFF